MSHAHKLIAAMLISTCIPVAASAFGQGTYIPFGTNGLAVSAGYGGGGGFAGPALGIGLSLLGRVDLGFAYTHQHQIDLEEPQPASTSFQRSTSSVAPFVSVYVAKPQGANSLGASISASYEHIEAKKTASNGGWWPPTYADGLSISGDFWAYAFRSDNLIGVPFLSVGYVVPLSQRGFDVQPFSPFASSGLAFVIDSSRLVSITIEPAVSYDFNHTTLSAAISGGLMFHTPFER